MAFIPSLPNRGKNNNTAFTPHPTTLNTLPKPGSNSRSRVNNPATETQGQRTGFRTGGKIKTGRMENRYNSIAPRFNVASNNKVKPESQQMRKDRFYGIDSRSGVSVKFNAPKTDTLFINPFETSGYITGTEITNQGNRLAVNVVEFDPTGFSGSKASSNFNNIHSAMAAKLAADSNSSTQQYFTFQNFKTYISLVTELVDLWYEVDTILSWDPPTDEINDALIKLKSALTDSKLIETKYDVRTFLKTIFIPHGILEFVRWKNQSYRLSPLPQSTVMRLCSKTLIQAFDSGSVTPIIKRFQDIVGLLQASTTSSTQLSKDTQTTLTGIFRRFLGDYGDILEELPLSCNNSVYDADFKDYFINSSTLYDDLQYPSLTGDTMPFVTSQDPKDVSEATIALTGYFNNSSSNATGLMRELAYENTDGVKTNKWVSDYQTASAGYLIHTRNIFEWDITNDFHFVDNSQTNTRYVTKTPNGMQRVYIDGKSNADLCTRLVQNKMFGI